MLVGRRLPFLLGETVTFSGAFAVKLREANGLAWCFGLAAWIPGGPQQR